MIYVVIIVCVIAAVFIIFIFSIHKRTKKIELLNEKLKEISEHDSLTGLFNRRAMNDFLREKWDEIIKNELPLSMIMMDVDYFKLYNDFYGHQMGDDVLAEIGKIIQSRSRENDFSVRYGGEEFLIIMSDTSEEEALQVAKEIKQAIEQLHIKHEKSKINDYVTMSMGIYTSNDNMSSREVLSKTDKTLYEAKKTRNTIQQYSNI